MIRIKCIIVLIFCVCVAFSQTQVDTKLDLKQETIKDAARILNNYSRNKRAVRNVVKIVYFHANDQEPLPKWKERLTRTLDDVSKYYQEEFEKHGIHSDGIPFEHRNGQYVFHLIQGSLASTGYNPNSGLKIINEIYNKSNKSIDFSRDHVLIITGLCKKDANETYEFHSPYFGRGNSTNGVCFAADCEMLDARLLTDTIDKMTFTEMMVSNKKCCVAEFNSWYIGGIAHEMGHMFGLPHDFGNPSELGPTRSLMGELGSRHYRDYLWGGKRSSAFSTASILQLMSHPVFLKTPKEKDKTHKKLNVSNLQFSKTPLGWVVKLDMKTDVQPYAVVTLVRSALMTEYFNKSFSKVLVAGDSLDVNIGFWPNNSYLLRFVFLFPDGHIDNIEKKFSIDKDGVAREEMSDHGTVNIRELLSILQKQEQSPINDQKIRILQHILDPGTFADPSKAEGTELFLSDAQWLNAKVGWEKVARNYYTTESVRTFFLENQGKLYSKGFFAHSPSSYVFRLGKRWSNFSGIVGLRDGANIQGSARFTILGDGKVLYESEPLRVTQQSSFDINVSGVNVLELKTNDPDGHNFNSWAVWLNPLLKR